MNYTPYYLVFFLLFVASVSAQPKNVDSIVHATVKPFMDQPLHVGLSVGVHYQGKDYFYNFGTSKLGTDSTPDNHTLYEAGSITKTFTSTLLALAVNKKLVTLDQHVTDFLPDSVAKNPHLQDLTLQQLSNHTSGLPRLPFVLVSNKPLQPYEDDSIQRLFGYLDTCKLNTTPGTVSSYSNVAVGLLTVILEKIYGKPYATLVEQYITRPAGLLHTGVHVKGRYAQGYNLSMQPLPVWNFAAFQGVGAIKTDTYDLLQYAKLQWRKETDSLQQAITLTHQRTYADSTQTIGLAWFLFPRVQLLFHNGQTGGYHAFMTAMTGTETAVVLLSNISNTDTDNVGWNITAALAR